jgi:hypothetical protein
MLMSRRRLARTPLAVNVALAWTDLGFRWIEMMAASGQVVSRRTRRCNSPAQLFEMGSEKALAAIESSHAMARQMVGFPTRDALAMWNAWARVLSSGVAPYHSRAVRNARAGRRRR